MASPQLTIITSTNNAMTFFRETAESVLRLQVDYEWLIADNASTDGTAAYLAELAGRSDRIRYRVNPVNLGGCNPNFRSLLPEARGEYVLFLDGDDTLASSGALETGMAMLHANPDVHVAVSKVAYMDDRSRVYMVKPIPFARYGRLNSGRRMFWSMLLAPTYPLKWGAVLVRRKFYEVTGAVFDLDFMFAATRHSRFALVDAVGLNYRNHVGSNTSRRPTIKGDRWWTNLANSYLPNDVYLGLKYPVIAYKWLMSQLKSAYRLFSPKRI
jgi:glycosyltransferase involved in cell wall biosynthesis